MASLQKKVGRVRPPRVQIKYEVDTDGAMEMVELPFVVGVVADLSGKPATPLKRLADRDFVKIDRDNFNDVMARATPRAAFEVENKLTDPETKLKVELNFRSLEDFMPARVAEQVPALRELLEMRKQLKGLEAKLEGNDKLEELLSQVIGNTELAQAMKQKLEGAKAETPKEDK